MAKKVLLTSNRNFYKGNMHCHSTLSDGKQTPEEIKELFMQHGYSFVAFTEHEYIFDNSYLTDENFVALTGVEYGIKECIDLSPAKYPETMVCHINLYAKDPHNTVPVCHSAKLDHHVDPKLSEEANEKYGDYPRNHSVETINEIVRIANENGFLVQYNHPSWNLENYNHYSKFEGFWGVEVFNYGTQRKWGTCYDIHVLDDMLRCGKRIFVSSGDDNHSVETSLGGFVVVNADSLTYENIINGLEKGEFYASQGPLINELTYEDGKFTIKSSDAQRIVFTTAGRRHGAKLAEPGKFINEAEFEVRDTDVYFRIDVIDQYGKSAHTQAYFIEDLNK